MLLFTDASRHDDVVGIGYVIRDARDDDFPKMGRMSVQRSYTSTDSEAMAVLYGMYITIEYYEPDHLTVYSDCQVVVDKLQTTGEWEFFTALYDVLAEQCGSCEIRKVNRSNNTTADRLASEAAWAETE